jgi:hypothetical protein
MISLGSYHRTGQLVKRVLLDAQSRNPRRMAFLDIRVLLMNIDLERI